MSDFEMRNFYHFPIEKTSYDLKLELIEELDRKEAMELMKVNNGFRSIYLKDPWRIFGRHVHAIGIESGNKVKVCKLRQSAPFPCDFRYHLPLFKKIKSCVIFTPHVPWLTLEEVDAN